MTKHLSHFLILLLSGLLLTACSTSRYSMKYDAAPVGDFDASAIPDVVPRWEPMSRSGNKSPYRVLGKTYTVLPSAKGYFEEGIASWYGLKFHGELTSNGEVYDMYALSAAHKSLPLPSYLKVTNLENDKSIIVRVNDRGPFHSDRIIDLSYAAAKRLGYQSKGTARVRLEAINLDQPNMTQTVMTDQGDKLAPFIQIAAFSSESSALKKKADLQRQLSNHGAALDRLFIAKSPDKDPPIYRLRMGPFVSNKDAEKSLSWIKSIGLENALLITRSIKGMNL